MPRGLESAAIAVQKTDDVTFNFGYEKSRIVG